MEHPSLYLIKGKTLPTTQDSKRLRRDDESSNKEATLSEVNLLKWALLQKPEEQAIEEKIVNLSNLNSLVGMEKDVPSMASIILFSYKTLSDIVSLVTRALELKDYPQLYALNSYLTQLAKILERTISSFPETMTAIKS